MEKIPLAPLSVINISPVNKHRHAHANVHIKINAHNSFDSAVGLRYHNQAVTSSIIRSQQNPITTTNFTRNAFQTCMFATYFPSIPWQNPDWKKILQVWMEAWQNKSTWQMRQWSGLGYNFTLFYKTHHIIIIIIFTICSWIFV